MKTEKIEAALAFIEEQLKSLKQNQFNGTFTIRLGYKDGGICTTGITVDHKHVNGIPNIVQHLSTGSETKNN